MGAAAPNDVAYTYLPVLDRRFSKQVRDNVHGNIFLDPLCLKFVDTEQFQRLRDLKQLGLTHMVFPGAVHTRFEHSLGVYWLASEAVHTFATHQGNELGIEHSDVSEVKLAGLLHDVGHGPFSHLFEKAFLRRSVFRSHEDMSVKMIDYMVDEHNIDIDPGTLKNVKEMISASCEHASLSGVKEKRFLYDIVANGRTGIDVDKFDYIARDSRACGLGCNFQFERLMHSMRVIGDEICYRANDYLTIHKLFAARADMHRTVYSHAKVKAIDLMVVDALSKADQYLGISASIQDPSQFWKLDDSILKRIETDNSPELKESRDLILRIRRRDLYQFCNEFSVPKDMMDKFKNVTPEDIICSESQKANGNGITLSTEDVAVSIAKIDLTRGKNNPLESIKFFKDYESDDKFPIRDESISNLLPASFQDMIVRVYAKKPELVEAVSEAFENYQRKTLGETAQVHETPKKRRFLTTSRVVST
ncbi:hypothetical protein ACFE04_023872 [Oxalis oulophora]